VGVGLHDQIHVDLYGLELLAVMDVSILRELLGNILETLCEHVAPFVALGDLQRRGIGMVSIDDSVGGAHDGGVKR